MKNNDPILLVGGYGAVGSEAARTLRRLYPRTKLMIAGRNRARAAAFAAELGEAEGVHCDLTAPDLGLAPDNRYGGIVVFAKDERLHAFDQAVARGAPYVSMSEYAVEIAPLIARSNGDGRRIPILLLSHHLGGLVTMVTLNHAVEMAETSAVRVGAIFDPADLGGATAQADAARVARAAPYPLLLQDRRWVWGEARELTRRFSGADGAVYDGAALSLLDVTSIAAATKASSVRFDVALREASATSKPRHEVVIEIEGFLENRQPSKQRIAVQDGGFHTRMSGRTIAFALERLLGLDGQPAIQPGLHFPENMLNAARIVGLARDSGIRIDVQQDVRV